MVELNILPQKKKVFANKGASLLDVLKENGIFLNTRCGGKGICGKCLVRINGREVLSCVTEVTADADVFIPEISTLDDIHSDTLPLHEKTSKYAFNPLLKKVKIKVDLSPKNINSDWEKLLSALSPHFPGYSFTTEIENLQNLGDILRKSNGEITAVLFEHDHWITILYLECGDTTDKNYGIAVDIGTTTVLAYLVDMKTGRVVDARVSYNKQIIYGEDVITRIIFAETREGLDILHYVVTETINDLIYSLVVAQKIFIDDINIIAFAGNTTMTHILYKIYPEYIRKEPYAPTISIIPDYRAAKFGLKANANAMLVSAPCVSGYVGGDITAGVLASGIADSSGLSLLVDIGTNGEIVLGNKDFLVCAACSAGPAFEGVGIKSGIHAVSGAINKITIEKDKVKYTTISDEKPKGICGSGLIDLLSELLRAGIIDPSGKFEKSHPRVRKYERMNDEGYEFLVEDSSKTSTGEDIVITEADISNLIRSKGAVYLGMEVLLKETGFKFDDLDKIYISGGFGNYIDIKKAIIIGLLPDLPLNKFEFIGNSSITGTKTLLTSKDARSALDEIAKKMTYIDLSSNPIFMNEYTSTLFLPHTNLDLFPSVKDLLKEI